ncbi:MAG: septum formation protein Maf, partial [Chloroflexi bacterium]|nr:septum formation protein Maf [Chloroflexota bacterium]
MADRTLVLASGSPRRREIVKALDMQIRITVSDTVEGPPEPGEDTAEYARRLSLEKARASRIQDEGCLILGADTIVVHEGEILGKPADEAQAVHMLERLRGRTHSVITGVTLLDVDTGRHRSATRASDVVMRSYGDEEIRAYVESGEPMDKAGAYAAQDDRFSPASEIRGCYLNVVGLPLCDVIDIMAEMGVKARLKSGWTPPDRCRECPLRQLPEVAAP